MKSLKQAAGVAVLMLCASLATAEAQDGAMLFEEKCAMCHREAGMGTGLLARRMDAAVAKLESRRDLNAEYVIHAARIGIGNMPRIPRGEVSDAQLKAIADYLVANQ
ncbi:MAG: cytochrome c [Spongiibacteraceae bacterium]|jgi:mono/diheme cytochrome c family protein|nr:cytochrome c [Spongiibacteraceae bacterium]